MSPSDKGASASASEAFLLPRANSQHVAFNGPVCRPSPQELPLVERELDRLSISEIQSFSHLVDRHGCSESDFVLACMTSGTFAIHK